MPVFIATNTVFYLNGAWNFNHSVSITYTDNNDNNWTVGEGISEDGGVTANATLLGTIIVNGTAYPLLQESGVNYSYLLFDNSIDAALAPADLTGLVSQPFPACFSEGALIATPTGELAIESLSINDEILTADGQIITVKWIGLHKVMPIFAGSKTDPVRFMASSLGDGVPSQDLIVTSDHGMILDDLVINASALVNGNTIKYVTASELPTRVTYYHLETANHDVIIDNGAPAETFIDYRDRAAFDNHAEYISLYGAERIIPEMDRPRISSARMVPDVIKARLGIKDCVDQLDDTRVA